MTVYGSAVTVAKNTAAASITHCLSLWFKASQDVALIPFILDSGTKYVKVFHLSLNLIQTKHFLLFQFG